MAMSSARAACRASPATACPASVGSQASEPRCAPFATTGSDAATCAAECMGAPRLHIAAHHDNSVDPEPYFGGRRCSQPGCRRNGARLRDLGVFEPPAEDRMPVGTAPAAAAPSVAEPKAQAPTEEYALCLQTLRDTVWLLRQLLQL